jgi:hypothetical protein
MAVQPAVCPCNLGCLLLLLDCRLNKPLIMIALWYSATGLVGPLTAHRQLRPRGSDHSQRPTLPAIAECLGGTEILSPLRAARGP